MAQHHFTELTITPWSQIFIEEGIDEHNGIEEPTQIGNAVGEVSRHAEHPYAIRAEIKTQEIL